MDRRRVWPSRLGGAVAGAAAALVAVGAWQATRPAPDRAAQMLALVERLCLPFALTAQPVALGGLVRVEGPNEVHWYDARTGLSLEVTSEACAVSDVFAHLSVEERARAAEGAVALMMRSVAGVGVEDLSGETAFDLFVLVAEPRAPGAFRSAHRPSLSILRPGADDGDPSTSATTITLRRPMEGETDA